MVQGGVCAAVGAYLARRKHKVKRLLLSSSSSMEEDGSDEP